MGPRLTCRGKLFLNPRLGSSTRLLPMLTSQLLLSTRDDLPLLFSCSFPRCSTLGCCRWSWLLTISLTGGTGGGKGLQNQAAQSDQQVSSRPWPASRCSPARQWPKAWNPQHPTAHATHRLRILGYYLSQKLAGTSGLSCLHPTSRQDCFWFFSETISKRFSIEILLHFFNQMSLKLDPNQLN